jgi:type-F conjugative transfer system pilin assembly protein TrbC
VRFKLFKLIRLVLVLVISSNVQISLGDDLKEAWADELASNAQTISMEAIKSLMNEPGFDETLKEEVLRPRPHLQIFVSSSLPLGLLKAYAREAKLYGGTLVFRGLPNGSIHKLTDLVMDISDEDSGPMQIDDEAFTAFGIKVVPAIVLAKPAPIFSGKTGSEKFDKISGAVKIKAGLELFARDGDMREEARNLLRRVK